MTDVDIVVLGLGPGGEAVAAKLAQAGLDVVGVEERLVGGECPYYGCIPSKMMVRAAGVLAEGRRVPELAGTSSVDPDWEPVAERVSAEATTGWDDQVAVDRLRAAGARFVRGHGRLAGPRAVDVDGKRYAARRGVVLNPGTRPAVPPVAGLADTPYWTNREALRATDLPASMAVLGGGPIGVELCQVFARFGVRMTMLEADDRLLGAEEPEASELVATALRRDGVTVRTDTKVAAVRHEPSDGFTMDLEGEKVTAEQLLVAAGRRPNLDDLGLETVGLDPQQTTLTVDERMRAGNGLWALGDVTGHGPFTHISTYQAGIAVAGILGDADRTAGYHAVPRVTFCDPEVGTVGLTEAQARQRGVRVATGAAEVPSSARGWIHRAGNDGVVKVVQDAERGVLVGATSVGPTGGEVLSMLALAVHAAVPTRQLASMIYAFPTFHQAVHMAVSDLHSGLSPAPSGASTSTQR